MQRPGEVARALFHGKRERGSTKLSLVCVLIASRRVVGILIVLKRQVIGLLEKWLGCEVPTKHKLAGVCEERPHFLGWCVRVLVWLRAVPALAGICVCGCFTAGKQTMRKTAKAVNWGFALWGVPCSSCKGVKTPTNANSCHLAESRDALAAGRWWCIFR